MEQPNNSGASKNDQTDKRVNAILSHLAKLGSDDYTGEIKLSKNNDEIDRIGAAINELTRNLSHRSSVQMKREDRINALLAILLKYTVLDFSEKFNISNSGDEIDALGVGLNALGEELEYHIQRLQDREEQINTIFKNAPDAVVVIDAAGIIVQWNPAAEKTFGWTHQEVLGKDLHSIIIPERYRERHIAGLKRFLITGKGNLLDRTIQMPAIKRDGSEIEMELTISPATLKDDYLFISFLRDITERKKAEEQIIELNSTLEKKVSERTEEFLESERKYRNLFENNPMPMWVLESSTLRFLDINESAIRQYGYSREEFLSMTATDIRPEQEKKRFLELDRSGTGTTNTGIWRHIKKDGSIIHVEVSVHETAFDGRRARLVLSNDVTEKQQSVEALRFSESRFRKIFESRLIGFLFWNSNGLVTDANDFFLEHVGYSRQDLAEGRIHWTKMTPIEYVPLDELALTQIQEKGICDPFEKEFITKNGSLLPVLIGAASLDGDSEKGIAFIMDISQSKKMQQEILELNRNLEVRIKERTSQLELANKELESFSYSVSHDLRAPLRAIDGYSQMLLDDYGQQFDQEGKRMLNNVKLNARKMGQLVDDLLEFSRMGKRALNTATISMDSLVENIIRDLNHIEEIKAQLIIHPLGSAVADGALLHNVFQNLILNAIKYSSKKENPVIEIGATKKGNARVFHVKDNGAGFDMAYYNKLFGVFQRLHRQDEFEGTGVGLAIVQRIIVRHGGKVWAEGRVNEGASFYFSLPNHS
jgi:PAS domain S-box-containing protein